MQLSLHADYSFRVLIYLACSKREKSSIEDIAKAYGISQNHLVKVVHRLGKEGYLHTIRGRGGGISLAKEPSDIGIGEVVRKFEPHFNLVECLDKPSNTCPIAGRCGLTAVLGKAKEAFLKVLDEATLADAVKNQAGVSKALGIF